MVINMGDNVCSKRVTEICDTTNIFASKDSYQPHQCIVQLLARVVVEVKRGDLERWPKITRFSEFWGGETYGEITFFK